MGAADWREGYAPAYVHMHMSQGRKASHRGGSKCILSKPTLCLTWGLSNTFFSGSVIPFLQLWDLMGICWTDSDWESPHGRKQEFYFFTSLTWPTLWIQPCSADPDWEPVHISWSLSSCNDAILCLEPFKNLVFWHQSFSPSLNPQKSAMAG